MKSRLKVSVSRLCVPPSLPFFFFTSADRQAGRQARSSSHNEQQQTRSDQGQIDIGLAESAALGSGNAGTRATASKQVSVCPAQNTRSRNGGASKQASIERRLEQRRKAAETEPSCIARERRTATRRDGAGEDDERPEREAGFAESVGVVVEMQGKAKEKHGEGA